MIFAQLPMPSAEGGAEMDILDLLLQPEAILTMVVVFGTAWLFNRMARVVLTRLSEKFTDQRLALLRFAPIISIATWTAAIAIVVKAVFQADQKTIAALVGASVFAIGFAAQDLFKNFLGGLTILFDRPFQVGDKVEISPYYGEIVSIGLRSTKLVTNDDNLVTVPNSKLLDTSVSNGNAGALDFQVVTDIYLPAHTDVYEAEAIAWQAAATSPYAYLDKPIAVRVGDAYQMRPVTRVRIKAYVLDIRLETLFQSDISKRAKRAFMQAGLLPETFGMDTDPEELSGHMDVKDTALG